MAYKPKSKRTNSPVGPQGKKVLDGLTANKNIDDIRALSKISNTQSTSISTLNTGLSAANKGISQLSTSKQNKLTLTTNGTSGPATLNNDTLNVPDYSSGGGGSYVPYTGATGNVDLGEFELKAGQLSLDTTPTGTAAVGTTRWNDAIGSSETTLKGGSVILKNGVDLVARVVNKVTPNTTLTKANYPAVRVSGAQGQRLAVAYAQANNDNNSADTIGLVIETIATNQEGFVMTVGQLEGVNTTGSLQGETWADGDVLYLSPTTAGRLTNIKPTGLTGHIVVMGYVEYAHAIHGKIYVKIMNGWELDELHNVYINPGTLANNNLLQYDSADQLWKNKSLSSAGIEPAIAPGTTLQYWRGDKTWQTFPAIPTVSPSALTKTDDTNVTLTLGGSPSNALLQAVSLTLGWSGTLADSRIASAATWNAKQNALTLTTTGTSGPATLIGATLNIPQYSGGGGGGGIHALVKPRTGRRVIQNIVSGATTGANFTVNRLVLTPFIPANTFTISEILMNGNIAVAGSLCRLLIYSDNNGVPNSKLYESSDLNLATTGFKIATTTFTFNAGTTYWLGFHGGAVASNIIQNPPAIMLTIANNPGSSSDNQSIFFVTAVLGSAPATITNPTAAFGNAPWIALTPA
jgi:nitrogen fixation protein